MVKSLQFCHRLTISQMSGLSLIPLTWLLAKLVIINFALKVENIETKKLIKVTFKNSVNGKIQNMSSSKQQRQLFKMISKMLKFHWHTNRGARIKIAPPLYTNLNTSSGRLTNYCSWCTQKFLESS